MSRSNIQIILACSALIVGIFVIVPRIDDLSLNQDFPLYNAAAQKMMSGDFLLPDFQRNAPGWPLYLSFVYRFVGSNSYTLAVSQILLHVILVLLIFEIACNVTNERDAIIAASVGLVWPSFLFQMRHGTSGLLYTVLISATILFLIRAIKYKSLWRAVVGGVLLGLGTLTDVVGLLLPGVFVVWGFMDYLRSPEKINIWKYIAIFCVFCVSVVLVVAPWTTRNILLYKDFSNAPIIAKTEQNYFIFSNIQKAFQPFLHLGQPLVWESVIRVLVFPGGLHALGAESGFSYKEYGAELLMGKRDVREVPMNVMFIFMIKIIIATIHLMVLIGAIVTSVKSKKEGFSLLVVLLIGYVVFAVTSTIALSNGYFHAISLPSGFLVSVTPFIIILATIGYMKRVDVNKTFSVSDVL